MAFRKCTCCYVPPHVTDMLAKRGDDQTRAQARATALQAKASRVNRSVKTVKDISTVLAVKAAPPTQNASREVYICQNKWEQRVSLARGEGAPATSDDVVNKVYEFAGVVRDYYIEQLKRNSIDNQAMNLILNVHYGEKYMNAFWDGDEMTFGDGDGSVFSSFAQSLDVMAHELAHGVTQYTANLDYYSQSGALNEHFSDVFGSAITQHFLKQDAGGADWLVGNEIMGPTLFGEALRSMKAPGSAFDNTLLGRDPQPSHMRDYYEGPDDNRGVHINSGIPNRVFFLVSSDIGTLKAAKIWYHALQNLWPTANFNDAAEVIVEAARTLTKENVVPEGTTQTCRLAFKDVGLPA